MSEMIDTLLRCIHSHKQVWIEICGLVNDCSHQLHWIEEFEREGEIMREIEEHVMFERERLRLIDLTLMSLMVMMPHEIINLYIQRAAPTRETLTLFLAFELLIDWFLVVVVAHDNHRTMMMRSLMMIEEEQALADLEHQLVGKPHHRALGQVSNHEHHQYSFLECAILADASHIHKSMM